VSDETNFNEISFEQNETDCLSHYSETTSFPDFDLNGGLKILWLLGRIISFATTPNF